MPHPADRRKPPLEFDTTNPVQVPAWHDSNKHYIKRDQLQPPLPPPPKGATFTAAEILAPVVPPPPPPLLSEQRVPCASCTGLSGRAVGKRGGSGSGLTSCFQVATAGPSQAPEPQRRAANRKEGPGFHFPLGRRRRGRCGTSIPRRDSRWCSRRGMRSERCGMSAGAIKAATPPRTATPFRGGTRRGVSTPRRGVPKGGAKRGQCGDPALGGGAGTQRRLRPRR